MAAYYYYWHSFNFNLFVSYVQPSPEGFIPVISSTFIRISSQRYEFNNLLLTLQNGIVDPFRFGTFSVQYVLFLVMIVLVLIPEPRRTDFVPHDKDDVSPLEILLSPVQKSKDKSYVLNGCREFPVQRKMPHFCLVSHGGGKTDRCGRAGDTHWCTMTLLTYATKTNLRWWPVASRRTGTRSLRMPGECEV